MVVDPVVRWALSAVFAVTAVCYLYGLAQPDQRGPGLRLVVDDALHVLMGLAMIAMLWAWGSSIPVMAYVLVFTSAALWFVARALFIPSAGVVGVGDPPVAPGHHGFLGMAWYHAAMMGSMIWMTLGMAVGMSNLPTASSVSPSADMSGMDGMPGMSMPGMDMGSSSGSGISVSTTQLWIRVPNILLAIGFAAAAIWLVTAGVRGRGRHSVVAGALSGLMAIGMAGAFIEMT